MGERRYNAFGKHSGALVAQDPTGLWADVLVKGRRSGLERQLPG